MAGEGQGEERHALKNAEAATVVGCDLPWRCCLGALLLLLLLFVGLNLRWGIVCDKECNLIHPAMHEQSTATSWSLMPIYHD